MNENIKLMQGDCLERMKDIPSKSIDICLTDPPYGIGISKNPFRGKFEKKEWDSFTPGKEYFEEIIRISKNQIVWGGNYFSDKLPNSRGFFIWDKKQSEKFSSAMCEMAYSSKQRPAKIFRKHAANFQKFHPTTKPVDLMEWCLSFFPSCKTVIDPFMGSGSTGVACINTGRKFIGIELDKEYFDIATKRINEAIKNNE
jgi:DNA modification methylase